MVQRNGGLDNSSNNFEFKVNDPKLVKGINLNQISGTVKYDGRVYSFKGLGSKMSAYKAAELLLCSVGTGDVSKGKSGTSVTVDVNGEKRTFTFKEKKSLFSGISSLFKSNVGFSSGDEFEKPTIGKGGRRPIKDTEQNNNRVSNEKSQKKPSLNEEKTSPTIAKPEVKQGATPSKNTSPLPRKQQRSPAANSPKNIPPPLNKGKISPTLAKPVNPAKTEKENKAMIAKAAKFEKAENALKAKVEKAKLDKLNKAAGENNKLLDQLKDIFKNEKDVNTAISRFKDLLNKTEVSPDNQNNLAKFLMCMKYSMNGKIDGLDPTTHRKQFMDQMGIDALPIYQTTLNNRDDDLDKLIDKKIKLLTTSSERNILPLMPFVDGLGSPLNYTVGFKSAEYFRSLCQDLEKNMNNMDLDQKNNLHQHVIPKLKILIQENLNNWSMKESKLYMESFLTLLNEKTKNWT